LVESWSGVGQGLVRSWLGVCHKLVGEWSGAGGGRARGAELAGSWPAMCQTSLGTWRKDMVTELEGLPSEVRLMSIRKWSNLGHVLIGNDQLISMLASTVQGYDASLCKRSTLCKRLLLP